MSCEEVDAIKERYILKYKERNANKKIPFACFVAEEKHTDVDADTAKCGRKKEEHAF